MIPPLAPAADAPRTVPYAVAPPASGGHAAEAAAGGAPVAYPPLTLEGWYAHHQLLTVDRERVRAMPAAERAAAAEGLAEALERLAAPAEGGWTAPALLVGAQADAMVVHFRPTLDLLGEAQRAVLGAPLGELLRPAVTYLSVTEAGMYQAAGQLAKAALARGGQPFDAEFQAEAERRLAAEREDPRTRRRLYPPLQAGCRGFEPRLPLFVRLVVRSLNAPGGLVPSGAFRVRAGCPRGPVGSDTGC